MVDKAIVLAAGAGTRLRPLTDRVPKTLVEVNGVSILENALTHLHSAGIREAVIVTGHHGGKIIEKFGRQFRGLRISYVENECYATTNNSISLWLAREHLCEDVLLLEGDVFFERAVLDRLLAQPSGNLAAVDDYQAGMNGTIIQVKDPETFRRTGAAEIERLLLGKHQPAGFDYRDSFKTVNIYLFREDFLQKHFLPHLEAYLAGGDETQYYEIALAALTLANQARLSAVRLHGLQWFEIDDLADLEVAAYRSASAAQKYARVTQAYGTYQRFDFTDHSYLYNLHFPVPAMYEEMQRQLHDIVINYPAGQVELAALVARWSFRPAAQLVVGNGSAELIKMIGTDVVRDLTISVPTYNEYENTVPSGRVHRVPLEADTMQLDMDRFHAEIRRSHSNVAVVVSPNNPTSLAVPRDALLELLRRLEGSDCLLLVDESFLEFAPADRSCSLESEVDRYPNLAIMNSMTKVFGTLGLRLGYVLSANDDLIQGLRRRVPIFNVNGLAEAFLRLLPRFRKQFETSCALVRAETDELYRDLQDISWLDCYPPDANFVFARVQHPRMDACELTRRLFTERGILIKHCAGKSMPNGEHYVRIASRTQHENRVLVRYLRMLGEDQRSPLVVKHARPLGGLIRRDAGASVEIGIGSAEIEVAGLRNSRAAK